MISMLSSLGIDMKLPSKYLQRQCVLNDFFIIEPRECQVDSHKILWNYCFFKQLSSVSSLGSVKWIRIKSSENIDL